jgi:segregation and condensation protein B
VWAYPIIPEKIKMSAKLESQIESILLFRNEPVTVGELAKLLGVGAGEVKVALENLQNFYQERGIVVVVAGEEVGLGTHPENSGLIEKLQKEEFSRELGRAGLETLAIILYRGPVSRREIDQIRGVNSGFILRTLLIRGLIERTESVAGERSFSYQPTLKLFQHLGLRKKEELPEFEEAFKKLEEFVKTDTETNENEG